MRIPIQVIETVRRVWDEESAWQGDLEGRLVRSRGELMILPARVTKGAGLLKALGDRGLSQCNTIGVGADNDHSLDVCEIGVAVCGGTGQGKSYLAGLIGEQASGAPRAPLGDAGGGVPWSRAVNGVSRCVVLSSAGAGRDPWALPG